MSFIRFVVLALRATSRSFAFNGRASTVGFAAPTVGLSDWAEAALAAATQPHRETRHWCCLQMSVFEGDVFLCAFCIKARALAAKDAMLE
jgi:hypothetical protein